MAFLARASRTACQSLLSEAGKPIASRKRLTNRRRSDSAVDSALDRLLREGAERAARSEELIAWTVLPLSVARSRLRM